METYRQTWFSMVSFVCKATFKLEDHRVALVISQLLLEELFEVVAAKLHAIVILNMYIFS